MCLCSLFVHIHTDTPVDLNSFSLSLDNADDLLTEVFQYWVKNYGKILPTTSEDVDKVVEVFVDFFIESATTSLLDKLPSLAANATAALLYAAVDTEKALKSVRKMLETVRTIPDAHEILSTAVQKGENFIIINQLE